MNINVVLLAGGEGSRLWPLSTAKQPKQFITLPSINLSSFQLSLHRALSITKADKIIIITNAAYQDLLAQQFGAIGFNYNDFKIIFEQCSNNTGVAVYYSCCLLMQNKQDDLTYFFPTDHYISEKNNFFLSVIEEIDQNRINVFGEKVKNTCSNFGYFVAGEYIKNNYYHLEKFIEKPDSIQIKELENYTVLYRNLGIYLAKPSVLHGEFKRFYNDIPECKFDISLSKHNITAAYANLPIDKMITEKSSLLNIYEINFSWQDIGSFESLYQHCEGRVLIDCSVDSKNILKFNQANQEYNLEDIGNEIRIIKK